MTGYHHQSFFQWQRQAVSLFKMCIRDRVTVVAEDICDELRKLTIDDIASEDKTPGAGYGGFLTLPAAFPAAA